MRLRFQNYKEKTAHKSIFDISTYYFKKMKACKQTKYSRGLLEEEGTDRFGNGALSFERQESGLRGNLLCRGLPV